MLTARPPATFEHRGQARTLRNAFLIMAGTLLLGGCLTVPGIRWIEQPVSGPPLADGRMTTQFKRCDVVTGHSPWASTGHFNRCEVAYRAQDGTHVKVSDLSNEVRRALPRASELRHLLQQFGGRPNPSTGKHYSLYVAALNPTVIIGVPNVGRELSSCSGSPNCSLISEVYELPNRYSERTSFPLYWSPAPVRDGAFVLIPQANAGSEPLPESQLSLSVAGAGRPIGLEQHLGFWKLSAVKP